MTRVRHGVTVIIMVFAQLAHVLPWTKLEAHAFEFHLGVTLSRTLAIVVDASVHFLVKFVDNFAPHNCELY